MIGSVCGTTTLQFMGGKWSYALHASTRGGRTGDWGRQVAIHIALLQFALRRNELRPLRAGSKAHSER